MTLTNDEIDAISYMISWADVDTKLAVPGVKRVVHVGRILRHLYGDDLEIQRAVEWWKRRRAAGL